MGVRALALAGFAALALAGCDSGSGTAASGGTATAESSDSASSLDPLLASPQVGDVWAGELTAFSSYDFSGGSSEMKSDSKAYGLMRVVEVSDDRVTIITETGAWPEVRGAVGELRGDMAGITWDENERIPVNRSDFAQLVEDGKIAETRRMAGQ
jgi:hypothetical protein